MEILKTLPPPGYISEGIWHIVLSEAVCADGDTLISKTHCNYKSMMCIHIFTDAIMCIRA